MEEAAPTDSAAPPDALAPRRSAVPLPAVDGGAAWRGVEVVVVMKSAAMATAINTSATKRSAACMLRRLQVQANQQKKSSQNLCSKKSTSGKLLDIGNGKMFGKGALTLIIQ